MSTTVNFSSIKLVKTYRSGGCTGFSQVIEVLGDIAHSILKAKVLFIVYNSNPMKRFIRVVRCFNCNWCNHISKFCVKQRSCVWYGKTMNKDTKFILRSKRYSNSSKGYNFNVKHPAFSKNCELLKFHILKLRLKLNSRIT